MIVQTAHIKDGSIIPVFCFEIITVASKNKILE